ncbi:MAG: cell wall hydrolase [Clostridia bacterium]|nr:cell wall hydrolase [Clostridia bacterium]
MQTKRKRRLGALLLLLAAFLLSLTPLAAETVSTAPVSVKNTDVSRYEKIPIYAVEGERLAVDGRLVESTTYLPLRAFLDAYMPWAEITYDARSRTATVNTASLTLSATDGSHILYANGRCLYDNTPIRILSDGRMYVPIRLLAKTLSLSVYWSEKWRSVTLSGSATPLESGDSFYDAEDLKWLSHIISAEAQGEPFIGQVAVGNVVLNRRAHSAYPDTVKAVIFDKQGGVYQFSPVKDGSIWNTPYYVSVTAAKVCLEGTTVSEGILFFYAPSMVYSTWIERNRPYAFTIAGHKFFY